jgi:hypothetical protein
MPWSSALAGALERDRQQALVAFIELRAQLRRTPSETFTHSAERAGALAETEHDYVALIEVGAEAARFQTELEAADREATVREVDTAPLLLAQMSELVDAVRARIPRTI